MTAAARTYADRLAAALTDRYADALTVTNSQGMLVFERGNARATTTAALGVDKRGAVSLAVLDTVAERAAARLAADIPHYRPEFVAAARELVAILAAGQITGTGVYGGPVDAVDRCAYVLDGRDTDGTPWHRCVVHESVEISPDAPCAAA